MALQMLALAAAMLLFSQSPTLVRTMTIAPSGFAPLELNPAELRLTNGASTGFVNISCGIPSDVTASSVYAITVSRYLKSVPTEHRLASAVASVNEGQAALSPNSGLTQNTATVSGGTSQKSLTLTLTQAKCEDAGTYVCKISFNAAAGDDTQIENIDVRENFAVIVPPGNITITADPENEVGDPLLGEVLTLTCSGMIGTYDPEIGQTSQWSWQYQDHESYSWTPYPHESDISKDPPFRGTSSCQYHQITRLTRYLTLEDSQRTYRCIVQANNNQGSSGAVYTLGIVADTELTQPAQAPQPSVCSDTTSNLIALPNQEANLSSPNYPYDYYNFANCRWLIDAGSGYVVKVTVTDVNLEAGYDFLEIYDGNLEDNETRIFRNSSMPSQSVFYSSGQYMYIRFYSDSVVTSSGFSLTYEAVDHQSVSTSGPTLTNTTATPSMCSANTSNLFALPWQEANLSSPNYPSHYYNFANCRWLIDSGSGYVLRVTVTDLSLEKGYDFLEIYDGNLEDNETRIFKNSSIPSRSVFYSSGQYMYIRFYSDYSITYSGFRLTYEAVDQQYLSGHTHTNTTAAPSTCNGITLSAVQGQVGYLTSSNYPSAYYSFINCSWTINADSGYVVKATLLNATSASYFEIDIHDGMSKSSPSLSRINSLPEQAVYHSSGQSMYITFVANYFSPNSFFNLTYEAVHPSSVNTSDTMLTSTAPTTSSPSIATGPTLTNTTATPSSTTVPTPAPETSGTTVPTPAPETSDPCTCTCSCVSTCSRP